MPGSDRGRPLISHVLDALAGSASVGRIRISVEPSAQSAIGDIVAHNPGQAARIDFVPAAETITDSIYAAAQGQDGPFIITTADNVLLTAGAVTRLTDRLGAGEDMVAALSRKEDVLSAHPEGQRRFYKFTDGSYSNCNLYGLSQKGLKLAETFRSGGQFSRNPGRIARAFGPLNLLLLRFGLVSLDRAMARIDAASVSAPRRGLEDARIHRRR